MPFSQANCAVLRAGLLKKPDEIKALERKIELMNHTVREVCGRRSFDENELYFLCSCIKNLTLKLQAAELQWLQELDLINKIIDNQANVQASITHINALKNDLALLQGDSALAYLDLHNEQFI